MQKNNIEKLFQAARKALINEAWLKTWRGEFIKIMEQQPLPTLRGAELTLPFRLHLRPAVAFALIAVLILGGGGVVAAAENSLPGDPLYGVKLASEKVTEVLTFSPEKKAQKIRAHAERRINELEALEVRAEKRGRAVSEKAIQKALESFEKKVQTLERAAEKLPPQAQSRVKENFSKTLERHRQRVEEIQKKSLERQNKRGNH